MQVLSVIVGLALLAVTPRLWRGTRTAVSLAAVGLLVLAVTSLVKGRWEAAAVEICLATLLTLGRRSFPIGCRKRPQLAVVCAAVGYLGADLPRPPARASGPLPRRPRAGPCAAPFRGRQQRPGVARPRAHESDVAFLDRVPDRRSRAHLRAGSALAAGACAERQPARRTRVPAGPCRSLTATAPIRCRRSFCAPTRRCIWARAACSPTA